MTTAQELYMNLTPHVLAACVSKPGDMTSAKQMADAIVRECVGQCALLGLLEDAQPVAQQTQAATPRPRSHRWRLWATARKASRASPRRRCTATVASPSFQSGSHTSPLSITT